jgi:hypothetical protein
MTVFEPFRAVVLVQGVLFAIEFVVTSVARGVFFRSVGRGLPGGKSLFFASPKKRNQKKGDPQSGEFLGSESKFAEPFGSPEGCGACTAAKLASDPNNFYEMGGNRGSAQTRLRLKQRAALIPISAHFTGPARTGFGGNSDSGSGSDLGFCSFSLWEKAGMRAPRTRFRQSRPGWAEERRAGWIRADTCLSEASLCLTPPGLSTARHREAAQTAGRLSFGYFSLAKQRKVTSSRATPGRVMKGAASLQRDAPSAEAQK